MTNKSKQPQNIEPNPFLFIIEDMNKNIDKYSRKELLEFEAILKELDDNYQKSEGEKNETETCNKI